MKAYIATFEMNNGYTCPCCRETWTEEREDEFEDGAPYDKVRKYFENMENTECTLLHIQRTDVSTSDIDELQDEVSGLKKELGLAVGALNKIIGKPPESPALLTREIRELVRETLDKLEA